MTDSAVLWLVFGLMTLVVVGILVVPLVRRPRRGGDRAEYDLEVYRDQLNELENDVERGVLTAEQASTARLEIERRVLQADREREAERPPTRRRGVATAIVLAVAVPAAAAALYAVLGRPDLPGQPLAERQPPPGAAGGKAKIEAGSLDDAVERLIARLEAEPENFDGWVLLGRTQRTLRRFDEAVTAYRRALALDGSNANIHAELGETLLFLSQGQVTPEALAAFEAALERDPNQPSARFYSALARAQAGDWQAAFDQWLVLAWESPPKAPWMAALEVRLRQAASRLGIDLSGLLPPKRERRAAPPADPSAEDMEAATQMTAEERAEMVRSMIVRLTAQLKDKPDDFDGWVRLGRAYVTQGDVGKAREAFGRAAALRPDDIEAQLKLATAVVGSMEDGEPLPAVAVGMFERVLAVDPDHKIALWYSGIAAAQAGRKDDAKRKWERLLEQLDPAGRDYATVRSRLDTLD